MTRSVEIPDDVLDRVTLAFAAARVEDWETIEPEVQRVIATDLRAAMRIALAALPYLVPAAPAPVAGVCEHPSDIFGPCTLLQGHELHGYLHQNAKGETWSNAGEPAHTAHPAAPQSAVPQPAGVEYEDEELETEADAERRNHWFRLAVELGQQDEFVEMLAHERRLPASRAEQSAVPQPVDREALEQALRTELNRQGVDEFYSVNGLARTLTGIVAAVLAGEQEQVEP